MSLPCFVTIVLGDTAAYHWQAWYALLTAKAHAPEGMPLAIITDQPHRYAWFGSDLQILAIDAATVREWAGPHQFRWRFKHTALLHAARHFPAGLVYADSDIQVRQSLSGLLQQLTTGAVFMHEREQVPSQARRGGHRRLWQKIRGKTFADLTVRPELAMWNAGVIAVGADRLSLLDRALAACDAMGNAGALDNLSEQFCFSAVLASTNRLASAAPWCDHYWGNKRQWQNALLERLAEMQQQSLSPQAAANWLR